MSESEPERIVPWHAGEYVKELMDDIGMNEAEFAKELGIAEPVLADLISGRARITGELALRLGRYFGMSAEYWMGLQTSYDLDRAEYHQGEAIVREVQPKQERPGIIGQDTPDAPAEEEPSRRRA